MGGYRVWLVECLGVMALVVAPVTHKHCCMSSWTLCPCLRATGGGGGGCMYVYRYVECIIPVNRLWHIGLTSPYKSTCFLSHSPIVLAISSQDGFTCYCETTLEMCHYATHNYGSHLSSPSYLPPWLLGKVDAGLEGYVDWGAEP